MVSAGWHEAVSRTAGLAVALATVLTIPECRGFDAPSVQVVVVGGTGGASGSDGVGGSSAGTAGDAGSGGTRDAANGGSAGSGSGGGDASSGAGGGGSSSGGTSGTGADGGDASSGGTSGDAAPGDYVFSEVLRDFLFAPDGGLYRGWTSIMPVVDSGTTHFVFYDTNSGVARFAYLLDDPKRLYPIWTHDAWYAGQSNLVPYYAEMQPFFVIYHPFLQTWNYNRLLGGLPGFVMTSQGSPKPDSGLPPTFTEILLFRQQPANYLFWYSRLDSSVRLERIANDGKKATTVYETRWSNGVTHAAGFSTHRGWYALMFRVIRQQLFFLLVHPDSRRAVEQVRVDTRFTEPFSLLTFYEFQGGYFVLLYGQDGTSALFEFDPSTVELNNVWRGTLRPGANVIAAFIDRQKPHVILSDPATGVGTFYAIERTTSDR
jgi:hypothetical protein